MESIRKAIKHFECVKSDAIAVLDSGFGTKQNESNTVYKNRKLYAELAINSLKKQIPKKIKINDESWYCCPSCGETFKLFDNFNQRNKHCGNCGQALDWSNCPT